MAALRIWFRALGIRGPVARPAQRHTVVRLRDVVASPAAWIKVDGEIVACSARATEEMTPSPSTAAEASPPDTSGKPEGQRRAGTQRVQLRAHKPTRTHNIGITGDEHNRLG